MTNPSGALLSFAAALALVAAAPALAQAPAAAGPAASADVLDPDAEAALARMGAALRAMKSFEVISDATTETVYQGNHKLQSLMRTTYTVQFPDRITIDMRGDTSHRRVYYDGAKMSVVALKAGKYVTFPVKGSVADVLAAAYEDYGIEFPLQDLFRWGDPASTVVRPTSGYRVGDAMIGDTKVGHYAFRQPGVDFQVWLEEGTQALPRKMVITNTEHPAQPQYVAYFRWNQAPEITADSFTFTPGPNDKLVDFGTAKMAVGSGK
jgi:hypothetical protein